MTIMELVVTPNESLLIKLLKDECNKEELKVGDCVIRCVSDKSVVCIIERKTVTDLWNSFRDHRYDNQKKRLTSLREDHSELDVVYIIEGSIEQEAEYRQKCIRACIHSLQSTTHMIVHRTSNIKETVDTLLVLRTFYAKESRPKTHINPLKVAQIKQRPQDDLVANRWFLHALMLVPQMSETRARVLVDNYQSLPTLMLELSSEEGLERVKNLKVTEKRTLGSVLANRIREHILYEDKDKVL